MPDGEIRLSHNLAQSRFGVHYVRGICSQAGFGTTETSIDEDVLAVDAKVEFPAVDARIQIKTTRTKALSDSFDRLTYKAKPGWLKKWKASTVAPVYFIVVVIPRTVEVWMGHQESGTNLDGTAAFWCRIRVEDCEATGQIIVPRANRLDAAAIAAWERDTLERYTGGGAL